jgi:hypothetical protein
MARHQEIITNPSGDRLRRSWLKQVVCEARWRSSRLMAEREAEIDAGLVHHTPAMVEALARLERVSDD